MKNIQSHANPNSSSYTQGMLEPYDEFNEVSFSLIYLFTFDVKLCNILLCKEIY